MNIYDIENSHKNTKNSCFYSLICSNPQVQVDPDRMKAEIKKAENTRRMFSGYRSWTFQTSYLGLSRFCPVS
jgi:hypothetical protein